MRVHTTSANRKLQVKDKERTVATICVGGRSDDVDSRLVFRVNEEEKTTRSNMLISSLFSARVLHCV